MDFLKKNWGLLLCSVVCICLFVVLIIKCFAQRAAYAEAAAQVQEHNNFFDKVNKDNLTVIAEDGELKNQEIAEANARIVSRHYKNMLADCATRYKITPELSEMRKISATKFREEVEAELASMASRLLKGKVNWLDGEPVGECFRELFDAGKQIEDSRRKQQVLRNIAIYDRIVDLVVNSGIKTVVDFNLPREYKDEEKDYYKSTPMVISVQGTSAQIQSFMNDMTYYKNLYCIIKSVGIELVDLDMPDVLFTPYYEERYLAKEARENEANGIIGNGNGMNGVPGERTARKATKQRDTGVSAMGSGMGGMNGGSQEPEYSTIRRNRMVGTDLGASAGNTGRMGGMGGMGEGPRMTTSRTRERNIDGMSGMGRQSRQTATMPTMGMDTVGGMPGMGGMNNFWHFGEPKRQDYMVFAKKRVFQLDLIVEIVEFNEPAEEETAEEEAPQETPAEEETEEA